MKKSILLILCLGIILGAGSAQAGLNIGVKIEDGAIKDFHIAIGQHYTRSEKEIVEVRSFSINDDEIPVVFFIAEKAEVPPSKILKMREKGYSWIEIAWHFDLDAGSFYVQFDSDPGPPYGKAYGYYKKMPRKRWGEIKLVDVDIINLVNLRFVSNYYGHSTHEVVKIRQNGRSFIKVHKEVKEHKRKERENKKMAGKAHPKTNKGKGKGKKH